MNLIKIGKKYNFFNKKYIKVNFNEFKLSSKLTLYKL